jgi:DNA-binding NtrC family response regulator
MERTLVGPTQVEVRGGTFSVDAADDVPSLPVGPEPRIIGRRPGCHLVLDDRRVSATHCEVVATERGVRVRDLGSSNGTYLGEYRIVEALLTKPCTLRCGDTRLEFHPSKGVERLAASKSEKFGPLVGATPVMRALFERLRMLAPTTVSVLVEGQTGTGKELVAQAIHEKSDRAAKPFVVVDCGAIPAGLAEATLFGHEKGAFTGAMSRRLSPFVEASGGTIFLDELGELPLDVQPKLLRVLAEQRVKSVGASAYAPVNVRVIAATRRDLLEEINKGAFRDDLYFRIAQERITVPSLAERTDDLAPLVQRLMEVAGRLTAYKRITPESFDRLERHDWPGNVRELRNLVSVALAYVKGGPIDLGAHLSARAASESKAASKGLARRIDIHRNYAQSRGEHDRLYFKALYDDTKGNLSEMARRADISRETVRIYLRTLKIGSYGS